MPEERFVCPVKNCGRRFPDESKLTEHVKRRHKSWFTWNLIAIEVIKQNNVNIIIFFYLICWMSKFFAEGNISDEEENSNQSDNENKDGKQPSYQYVSQGLFRIFWMKDGAMKRE